MSRLPLLLVLLGAVALGGCMRSQPMAQHAPASSEAAAAMAQPPVIYAASAAYQPPSASAAQPRGFFAYSLGGPFVRAPAPAPVGPCSAPDCAAPDPLYAAAYPVSLETPYLLDAGDRLRITVFGQEGLTNSYAVDAAGNVTMPLIGSVPARGLTTRQLSASVGERLKQGYIREPKVAIEVEAYRPFFIHGEVTTPGQYAYVANMTVEQAIAIAGGFAPRADRSKVTLSRTVAGQTARTTVGLTYPLRPGDTLRIGERWF